MCNFTYFGYNGCKFPQKHYLVRREMCPANAKILINAVKAGEKGWCSASLQNEIPAPEQQARLPLSCPLCSITPVVYEQPLLEMFQLFLGMSPKSPMPKLPAPHYHHDKDNGTEAYSRFSKYQPSPADPSASLFVAPLNTPRMQHERSTSGSVTPKAKPPEDFILPATVYAPPPTKPRPLMLTPPSSRDSSRSPPSRAPSRRGDGSGRPPPPGRGGSRHELDTLREKGEKALAKASSRPATPASERGRSSSSASNHSSSSSSSSSARYASQSRSPPQDRIAALKGTSVFSRSSSPSPERGRKMRRDRAGSSDRDGKIPIVIKPKISPPVLGPNSMGLGDACGAALEPFQQRLVPPQPARRRDDDDPKPAARPKTPHRAYSTFPGAQVGDYPDHDPVVFASASSGLGVGFGRDKPLPVPGIPALRRVQTGQVRVVDSAADPPTRRQRTAGEAGSGVSAPSASASHKLSVKTGNFFVFGSGNKAQEFEIVKAESEGLPAPAAVYGQAF